MPRRTTAERRRLLAAGGGSRRRSRRRRPCRTCRASRRRPSWWRGSAAPTWRARARARPCPPRGRAAMQPDAASRASARARVRNVALSTSCLVKAISAGVFCSGPFVRTRQTQTRKRESEAPTGTPWQPLLGIHLRQHTTSRHVRCRARPLLYLPPPT